MSDQLVGALIVLPIIALLPAWIARRKGHGFWTFYVAGLIMWLLAIIWALLAKDRRARCPECRELVNPEASRCPHCQAEIAGRVVQPSLAKPLTRSES